ncbi:hypothetical protein K523DRAFT_114177 [Schizophyllum commune Tattone D]|nr:hypothetical protein K523DRAFT_114177 [Schizophyllum commune Tattone D]
MLAALAFHPPNPAPCSCAAPSRVLLGCFFVYYTAGTLHFSLPFLLALLVPYEMLLHTVRA